MKKIKIKEIILQKQYDVDAEIMLDNYSDCFNREYYIDIVIEDDYHSENNSYNGYKQVTIYKNRWETDDEYEARIAHMNQLKKDLKNKRYETYLKLKAEFENMKSSDENSNSIEVPLNFSKILHYLKKLLIEKHVGTPFIFIEHFNRFSDEDYTLELKDEENSIFLYVYNKQGLLLKFNCNDIASGSLSELGSLLLNLNIIFLDDKNDIYLLQN